MKYFKNVFIIIIFLGSVLSASANEIQVTTFEQLMSSNPNSGDTIEILSNLTSTETIGRNFYGINISFQGKNHYIDGNDIFGGFVLNQDSLFNQVQILNCKGQSYNNSAYAGAIYNSGGTVDINNSEFINNYADAVGFNYAVAGAVYNLNGGTINISSSLFQNNYSYGASSYGGAIANGHSDDDTAHTDITNMNITNSIFRENVASGTGNPYGGAIYNQGNITISNTQFDDNYAQAGTDPYISAMGGAVYNEGIASISDCDFTNNKTIGFVNASSTGGAIYNNDYLTITNSSFTNNYGEATNDSIVVGGTIYSTGYLSISNTSFTSNFASGGDKTDVLGGVIYSNNSLNIDNSTFVSNNITAGSNKNAVGGVIYSIGNSSIKNTILSNNYVQAESGTDVKGGAIYNNSGMSIDSCTIENNTADSQQNADGGAIYNDSSGVITISNSTIANNKISSAGNAGNGGAIYNLGEVIIENSNFENNIGLNSQKNDIYNSDGKIYFEGSGTTNILSGISGSGTITKNGSGILNLAGVNENYQGTFNFDDGTLNLLSNSSYFSCANTTLGNDVNFNMQNGDINNIDFGDLTISGQTNLYVDANLSTQIMDTISASNLTGSGSLLVKNIAFTGVPKNEDIILPFANSVLKDYVQYTPRKIETPIYEYQVSYDRVSGDFNLVRGNFNPAILSSEVATQLGGYLIQLETYKNVFSNLDMVMLNSENNSNAFYLQNKIAYAGENLAYSPLMIPESRKGIWVKPYSIFENVPLRNGPKVSNVIYGSLVGGESELKQLKYNWYMINGAYASYNGSHQAYQGTSIYNNGGLIGINSAFYKGNLYSAWTLNAGANTAQASSSFGYDNFTMFICGIAQKTGYNFHLFENKLILQPNIMTSYSFVNTFNYLTSSGVNIDTRPLNALHIQPELKVIGNFKNYLQPYFSVSVAWNLIDHTKFQADEVYLSDLSVKPYVQYGVGVQKRWKDRATCFIESMIRNGGRNGIALALGLRVTF